MSTSTFTHHPARKAAPRAAVKGAAFAVVGVLALGAVAYSIADGVRGQSTPTEPARHAVAPPQHGSAHFEYSSSGGRAIIGP